MSIYPVLEVDSLEARCTQDIKTFTTAFPGGSNSVIYTLCTEADYRIMMNDIKTHITIINGILDSKNKNITNFDYSHDILMFEEPMRNKLWIIRTLLCYQMMIFGTHVMSNALLHKQVYGSSSKRTFRPEVITELPSFKLGIFGSITPTSDIDIGIQYSGNTAGFTALDYVVGIIEDMFILFLGIESTLKLDIEYYANLETLPNPGTNSEASPDLFYLDTTNFTEKDFNEMLPYAYASIYRNYRTAAKDVRTTYNKEDLISRLQTYGVVLDETKNKAMNEAMKMVDEYMSLSYNDARERYYELVRIAEKQVNAIRIHIREGRYNALTNKVIVGTMKALAHSLIFRAESYTCAPTVMHVVRLLQADPKKEKYPVTYPIHACAVQKNRLKNPQCGIGWFGYEMSILEQIGYMLRFFMTYCGINGNAYKCNKKRTKYETRYMDGKERQQGVPLKKQNNGGRRRLKQRTRRRTPLNIRKKHIKLTKRRGQS
jgi:hypothetical protein